MSGWTGLLLALLAVSLVLHFVQYRSKKKRDESLAYITDRLDGILSGGAARGKLLHVTDDKQLIALLNGLNGLVETNQRMTATYNKTEDSMRKMLANISHDLKTPLTVVLGYMETLIQNPSTPAEERERLQDKVHAKAREVLALINQFFDLARLESGDRDIPLNRIHLNEVCSQTILAFYEPLTSKGVEVVIAMPETSVYVLGNEEALVRILNNLISNASQYGSDGNMLGLTLREDAEHAYVEVWDRGKGISEFHQDRVFERMYTLEDSRNPLYQGSGLGLTITKRLVEKLGGVITLTSKPYVKTSFTVKLKKIAYGRT
ncbi:sensor histidine kinase [Paenibacillus chitinolyticus]|uniref:sensor histidine kinase n=1 Tax=Paenibacillus chitinolyticus TaxID=79263 RepID=UPI0036D7ED8D